jgi:hypothetical protein
MLQIIDLSGRVIFSNQINSNTNQISLPNEVRGILLLNFTTEKDRYSQKIFAH